MKFTMYKLFLGGIVLGVVISLGIVFLFFSSDIGGRLNISQEQKILPVFGEKNYDPEIMGYPAIIGNIVGVSTDEITLRSPTCLKEQCDSNQEYEYRAKITNGTILKRLTRKSEKEFQNEISSQKNPTAPPNPYREATLNLSSVRAGENITVLIKEIIDDMSVIAHEIRIFEPLPVAP